MHAWLDDSDDHLRWLGPTDLNLDYMGITHLDCVTLVAESTSTLTLRPTVLLMAFFLCYFQSGRSSRVTVDRTSSWSDEQSISSDQGRHDVNNVDFNSSPVRTEKFKTTFSYTHDKDSSAQKTHSHASAMKLGTKKPLRKTRKTKDEAPGNEYDIMQVAVRSREPDYFADMEPTVSFTDKGTKITVSRSHSTELSSKLAMVEDNSQVGLAVRLVHLYLW